MSHGELWGATSPRTRTRTRDAPEQLTLDRVRTHARTWGGRRKGAGRKAGPRPKVSHVTRPVHGPRIPVHITLRRARNLPSLRSDRLHREVREAIRRTRRDDFRIAHYSVQADHVHLIVEAEDTRALSSGMRSFAIRAALRINARVLRRRSGHLWGDRYHRRDLHSPRQVRNALVYVLANHLKHGETDVGLLDPCSSGPWWTGWLHILEPPPHANPVEPPHTWLLDRGWKRLGLIHLGEAPRSRT